MNLQTQSSLFEGPGRQIQMKALRVILVIPHWWEILNSETFENIHLPLMFSQSIGTQSSQEYHPAERLLILLAQGAFNT